jgi:pimeloyl-ACP methyl ester carboxylesterase
MLGISYGGSLGLVAAADPRLAGRLAVVAVFGAYFDLGGVIQAVTTGESLVGGRRIPWDGHPLARAVLQEQAVAFAPASTRAELRGAFAGSVPAEDLSPPARAVFDLVTNEDPSRTGELVQALPEESRSVLERFSPSTVAGSIRAPVVAMHSTDDPAVPHAELLRLDRALSGARTVTVEAFRHVDLRAAGPGAWLGVGRDVLRAWTFTRWMLEAQE